MGTFSKSLASCGGFIAGPAEVIDYMRIAARSFLFTAAAVPAAVAAALEAVRICTLRRGPRAVRPRRSPTPPTSHDGLRELGSARATPAPLADGTEVITPIVPIVIGDDVLAATALEGALGRGHVHERGALSGRPARPAR